MSTRFSGEVVGRYHALTSSTPQWGMHKGIFATLRSSLPDSSLDIGAAILALAIIFNLLITHIPYLISQLPAL
jgi:hypothetical protein